MAGTAHPAGRACLQHAAPQPQKRAMTPASGKAIDELMERASSALVTTNYFEAEKLALKALERACAAIDFERMARICMPLQEARRQKRHEAVDAGKTFIMRRLPERGETL